MHLVRCVNCQNEFDADQRHPLPEGTQIIYSDALTGEQHEIPDAGGLTACPACDCPLTAEVE